MASLIVRNLESAVVERLKAEAVRQKISAEEAHRRLLRRVLLEPSEEKPMSFKDFLLTIPALGEGEPEDFPRSRDTFRPVDL